MTWEQEMKEQAHFLAEEWAPVMAQDLAKGMAKDMAEEIAAEKAKNMAEEKSLETAKNLLDNNISTELVAKCTGLPLEQVLQLQKELMSAVEK